MYSSEMREAVARALCSRRAPMPGNELDCDYPRCRCSARIVEVQKRAGEADLTTVSSRPLERADEILERLRLQGLRVHGAGDAVIGYTLAAAGSFCAGALCGVLSFIYLMIR